VSEANRGAKMRRLLVASFVVLGEMGAVQAGAVQARPVQVGPVQVGPVQDLMHEIRAGSLTKRFLRKNTFNIKQLNEIVDGDTPLTLAIREQMPGAVKLLVGAGADVNKSIYEQTPIEIAVLSSTAPIVRHLMQFGAELTARVCRLASHRYDMTMFFMETVGEIKLGSQRDGNNSFQIARPKVDACLNNMLMDVRSSREAQDIIELGACTNYCDADGKTAVDYSAQRCQAQKTKVLLSQGAPFVKKEIVDEVNHRCSTTKKKLPDPCCDTARVLVNQSSNIGHYKELLDRVGNGTLTVEFLKEHFSGLNALDINRTFVDHGDFDALSLATSRCDAHAVSLLLKYGASSIRNAFVIALKNCPKDVLRSLIAYGAKLLQVSKPLDLIIQSNPHAEEIVGWIARMLPKIDRRHALLTACLKGNVSVAHTLLDLGARIDFEDVHGRTPLWNALLSQKKEMVQFVLDHGGDYELKPGQLSFVKKFFPTGYELLSLKE